MRSMMTGKVWRRTNLNHCIKLFIVNDYSRYRLFLNLAEIDVASALSLGNNLNEVVTYDKKVQQACFALGIPFVAP